MHGAAMNITVASIQINDKQAPSTLWFSDFWHRVVIVNANISGEYAAFFIKVDIRSLF